MNAQQIFVGGDKILVVSTKWVYDAERISCMYLICWGCEIVYCPLYCEFSPHNNVINIAAILDRTNLLGAGHRRET